MGGSDVNCIRSIALGWSWVGHFSGICMHRWQERMMTSLKKTMMSSYTLEVDSAFSKFDFPCSTTPLCLLLY